MRRYSLLAILSVCAVAAVVDRVAVVVGKTVFTQSEVEDETRVNELETGKPLDLSPARRKEAAERMVDQQLLRTEMAATAYQPPKADADAMLRQFRQQQFRTVMLYHEALTRYGVTEDALKQHLVWESTALQFADERFKPLAAPIEPTTDTREAAGKTGELNEHPSDAAAKSKTAAQTEEDPMDTWLKQQRAMTRIFLAPEAFQ